MTYAELRTDALTIGVDCPDDAPPAITRFAAAGVDITLHAPVPAIEISTPFTGHAIPMQRLTRTRVGSRLRYREHRIETGPDRTTMTLELTGPDGLGATWLLRALAGVSAVTSTVRVVNTGAADLVLSQVASLSTTVTGTVGVASVRPATLDLFTGTSDWAGENRWRRRRLRDELADLSNPLHPHEQKGGHVARSFGTWSTARDQPVGVLAARDVPYAMAWQIEHNGAWRWEVGEHDGGASVTLSGPTDVDHQWVEVLAPGAGFESVPVTLAVADGWQQAIAALTTHRRAARRPADRGRTPLIYNDYMNTLMGDPTTERLLPLVDAAADAGAEVFCIDAGWYDDGSDWWPSVGAWRPSTTRFPNGLQEVTDKIRSRGLVPGLWLEPEVIGVRSPMATELPDEAFLLRRGQRVVEAGRFHLDLRHHAARSHLDGTVDRLVGDLGVGMFKLDYNINPGPGTDHDAPSAGAGLLGHNRALLDWLDGVLDRHPDLVLENCGSGAMRADFAMLSRLNLQSTSDQQDHVRYPIIAAAAPMLMLPEQAGSWAYPAPGMDLEATALTLQAGLLGRLYLSGYLHRLDPGQLALVHEAVAVHKSIRTQIAVSRPSWPLGLPAWDAEQLALTLSSADTAMLTFWHRGAGPATIDVPVGPWSSVAPLFPVDLPGWRAELDGGSLLLIVDVAGPTARTFRLS